MSAHDHGHSDRTDRSALRERRLLIALGLNTVIVVAQVIFGIVAHSLGLLSDAGHNLTDVAALALSLIAVRVARRPATSDRSFGWHRGTILAAQANAAMILALTVWIVYEAIRRLIHPQAVEGGTVLVVALVAFVGNGLAVLVVNERSEDGHHDLNMRSALIHLASDALASLGVAIAATIMLLTDGWERLDPLVSLGIGLLIAYHAWKLLRSSTAVLLEGTPDGLDLDELRQTMAAVDGVEAVHDLHVWSLSSDVRALSAHVVVEGSPTLDQAQVVADRVKRTIATEFRIAHATLELEGENCLDGDADCDMDLVDTIRIDSHHH